MALVAEILKANEALKTLTPEQITAIETLSTNDENTVIAKKIGELHGQYDNDIKAVTGLEKPAGIKTYEWLKSDVLPKVKIGVEATTAMEQQKTIIADLKKQLTESAGDAAVKQQLADATTKMGQLQAKYETDKADWESKLQKETTAQMTLRIENEFDKGLQGLTFKDVKLIPESVRNTFIESAKNRILATKKPDFIDNGKGGKALVFRNEAGEILNNPENKLNPFTARELLLSEIKDILDLGKKQPGGGTEPPQPGGGGAHLDLTGAKTQVEADEHIVTYLLKTGLTKGSSEFAKKQTEIRKENKVGSLPLN